jgi:hypothetical protein
MPSLATRVAWFERGAGAFPRSRPTVDRDLLPPEIEPITCVLYASPHLSFEDSSVESRNSAI